MAFIEAVCPWGQALRFEKIKPVQVCHSFPVAFRPSVRILSYVSSTMSAFVYTNGKLTEKEIKEMAPFATPSNIKYLDVTLTKQVKDLCDQNLKTLKKELKKISEDEKASHVHGMVGLV